MSARAIRAIAAASAGRLSMPRQVDRLIGSVASIAGADMAFLGVTPTGRYAFAQLAGGKGKGARSRPVFLCRIYAEAALSGARPWPRSTQDRRGPWNAA